MSASSSATSALQFSATRLLIAIMANKLMNLATLSLAQDSSLLRTNRGTASSAVGLFLGPALTLQSVVPASPSTPSPSSSVIASSPSSRPFNSCSALLSSLSLVHFVLWSHNFVGDTRATHCPCQPKTGPVSSRHTHMSLVYTPLFTSNLPNDCAISIVSNVRILFIQHHDTASLHDLSH